LTFKAPGHVRAALYRAAPEGLAGTEPRTERRDSESESLRSVRNVLLLTSR
jgi:hypothetical protein